MTWSNGEWWGQWRTVLQLQSPLCSALDVAIRECWSHVAVSSDMSEEAGNLDFIENLPTLFSVVDLF